MRSGPGNAAVYFPDWGGKLWKIDAQTGTVMWSRAIADYTGIAGAFADALSMGSSGYLAAKSEAEVAARQVAIERDELRLMPEFIRGESVAQKT